MAPIRLKPDPAYERASKCWPAGRPKPSAVRAPEPKPLEHNPFAEFEGAPSKWAGLLP
jgi:hypothetical protein